MKSTSKNIDKNFDKSLDNFGISEQVSKKIQTSEFEKACVKMLNVIGEDPKRQGLLNTPKRYEKAIKFLTSGYEVKIKEIAGDAIFDEKSNDLVLVRDIEFFSLCEHHVLPFFGKVHVAYVPNGKVIGLSKIPRIVNAFARRLQVQERLTDEIAECINSVLKPKGVSVIIEASHLCMMMRGVEKQNSMTVTKSSLGVFVKDAQLRSELMSVLKK